MCRHGRLPYFKVIDGVRYDRKVLEDCEASVNDDGVIDLNDARRVVADVLDGPRREQGRGVKSAVTDCELATLRYAQSRFEWTEEAKAWVFGPRGVVASVDAGNDAPLDETQNAIREDDAGVGLVENVEDDEDDAKENVTTQYSDNLMLMYRIVKEYKEEGKGFAQKNCQNAQCQKHKNDRKGPSKNLVARKHGNSEIPKREGDKKSNN